MTLTKVILSGVAGNQCAVRQGLRAGVYGPTFRLGNKPATAPGPGSVLSHLKVCVDVHSSNPYISYVEGMWTDGTWFD